MNMRDTPAIILLRDGVHTIEPFVRIGVGYGKNGYLA
jgi:hypothetical protein